MIWALCRRIVGDEHSAADAAQEAMILVVKNLSRFDGRSSLRTWIYRVTTNAALDEVRRRGRRPEPRPQDDLPGHGSSGTSATDNVDDRLAVDAALAELPPEFRAVVVLRDLVDMEYADIAAVMNLPPGTVRSRIARGRRLLAGRLATGNGNPTGHHERPTDEPEASSNTP
jgi:RNA polymerase sigma-70 factor, ECF subfamily